MNLSSLLSAMPGAIAQGLIWGIMAIGVYITYKVLDVADLTVDGTMATGGVVCVALMVNGVPLWVALLCAVLAGMLAGLLTGVFHTFMGIPAILSGILTQFSLYSINLWIMGFKSNMAINVTRYHLLVSGRNVKKLAFSNPIFVVAVAIVLLILVLYWFFGTERGCALRATGREPCHGTRHGHQHRPQQDPGSDDQQRHRGAVLGAVHPVSGRSGCEHGPRRDRDRPGRRDYQRGGLQRDFP